ncbi:uncharacterized protein LOC134475741 [Cavia porcellus]|uniref:uncharacterized protein LOC134475741 n=1 Tax=Cavia porcellus TaxID=10141 RepID=UPI002FE172E9
MTQPKQISPVFFGPGVADCCHCGSGLRRILPNSNMSSSWSPPPRDPIPSTHCRLMQLTALDSKSKEGESETLRLCQLQVVQHLSKPGEEWLIDHLCPSSKLVLLAEKMGDLLEKLRVTPQGWCVTEHKETGGREGARGHSRSGLGGGGRSCGPRGKWEAAQLSCGFRGCCRPRGPCAAPPSGSELKHFPGIIHIPGFSKLLGSPLHLRLHTYVFTNCPLRSTLLGQPGPLQSRWKPSYPQNLCVFLAPKISTLWMPPRFAASWSRSQAFLLGCRGQLPGLQGPDCEKKLLYVAAILEPHVATVTILEHGALQLSPLSKFFYLYYEAAQGGDRLPGMPRGHLSYLFVSHQQSKSQLCLYNPQPSWNFPSGQTNSIVNFPAGLFAPDSKHIAG